MLDQYIREYWGDPEQCDKLIEFYKEADRQGFTKEGRVGSIAVSYTHLTLPTSG